MPGEASSAGRTVGETGRDFAEPPGGSAGRAPSIAVAAWDWDDLYSRLGRGLLALGQRRYGLAREDAEEALQRAATAIVLAAPSVRSPEAYLTAVLLRECAGIRRQRQETHRREPGLAEGFDPADDSCERIQVVCRFRKAFSLLSPFCRSVMRICLLAGKPRVEAAADLPGSAKTIHKRYRKCLRTLAHALG
ncbi:MAG: sigma-70 family RNA polymerase sigma factor [Deltaproteobacteria bacterium]|nr:sigma-70 family RNA polymerase sigma factor [Deltaproteobacteria bacterium]